LSRVPRLFEESNGSVLEGYLILREGGKNIPPTWIERTSKSRHSLHKEVARILKKGDLNGLATLRQWEEHYEKECFYRGIRALLELQRKGKTKL
jgi:hypothetical protein